MKKVLILILIAITAWSCHTPLSCVDKHPQNYIGRQITVTGFTRDWIEDFHGYYFIVLVNRYRTHHLVVYKQVPYLQVNQRIKATGYLRKTTTRNQQTVYVLVDTSNFIFKLKTKPLLHKQRKPKLFAYPGKKHQFTGRQKIEEPLRYRDTLPTLLWYQQEKK